MIKNSLTPVTDDALTQRDGEGPLLHSARLRHAITTLEIALSGIANQDLSYGMDEATEADADWVTGYDECIKSAREGLRQALKSETECRLESQFEQHAKAERRRREEAARQGDRLLLLRNAASLPRLSDVPPNSPPQDTAAPRVTTRAEKQRAWGLGIGGQGPVDPYDDEKSDVVSLVGRGVSDATLDLLREWLVRISDLADNLDTPRWMWKHDRRELASGIQEVSGCAQDLLDLLEGATDYDVA